MLHSAHRSLSQNAPLSKGFTRTRNARKAIVKINGENYEVSFTSTIVADGIEVVVRNSVKVIQAYNDKLETTPKGIVDFYKKEIAQRVVEGFESGTL
jgi:hypothetical protein